MKNQFHLQFNMNCWSVMVKLIRFRKWDFKMTWRFVEIRLIANAGNTNLSTTAHRCWLQYLMCSAASMPPKSNNNKIQTRHTYIYTQIMWLTHILAHTHSRCRCVLSEFYTHFAIYSITCAVFCIKWSLYFSSLFSLFFFFLVYSHLYVMFWYVYRCFVLYNNIRNTENKTKTKNCIRFHWGILLVFFSIFQFCLGPDRSFSFTLVCLVRLIIWIVFVLPFSVVFVPSFYLLLLPVNCFSSSS